MVLQDISVEGLVECGGEGCVGWSMALGPLMWWRI